MDDGPFSRVQDYTNAFLCMLYLSLITTLVLVLEFWGFAAGLMVCTALHMAIRHYGDRRARAEAEWEARVAAAIARHYDRRS